MNLSNAKKLSLLILLFLFASAFWGIFNIKGGEIATHFDANNNPNNYMPKEMGLLIIPVLCAMISGVLLIAAPKIMPETASIMRSELPLGAINISVLLILVVAQMAIITSAIGYPFNFARIIPSLTGIIFIVIGNYLPKIRRNYIIGIRTPWTLESEEVWDKTHAFSGPVFMITGLAISILAFFINPIYLVWLLMACIFGAILIVFFYSYAASKKIGSIKSE